ncbi:acyl-CoA dehydrogenase family protein [Bradyrhizobium sp. 2TAF24]|uniref:acyl-CoA dehydrogenase family protein n=1 Tax=Bradyrhizobium sp. 2TAF24 TaxID=3233011 RepID=UPI003F8E27D8
MRPARQTKPRGPMPPGDARKEAVMMKCFAPLAACRVIGCAMQIHGGPGML